MPVLRLPLVGSFVNRNANPASFTTKDQRFINCFPEVVRNSVTGKSKAYLNKRVGSGVGSALSGVASAGIVGAICSWTGNTASAPPIAGAFIDSGGTSTSVWDLSQSTKIGASISTTSDCIALTETIISTTAHLVGHFVNSGTSAIEQWYFPQGGAWTKVASNFPTNAVGIPVAMDGYVFTMGSDGKIWNSDINTIATIGASSYLTAQSMPDKGVSVARHKNYIVAFGETSIEFFYNAGNAIGSPLSSVKDSAMQMGAMRRASGGHQTILQAADTVYFIGTGRGGEVLGVFRLNGNAAEKVSNPAIDKACADSSLTGFVGTAFFHGQLNILVQGSLGVWAFCPATNFWWQLLLASGEIIYSLAAANVQGTVGDTTFFIGSNNAKPNQFAITATYQDDGAAYTATVRTEPIDVGTNNYKYWDELRIVADTQSSTSNLGVAWSDDDYATTSSVRNIDLSTAANNLVRLGRARRRSYTLTHAANTPFRAERLDLRYRVGAT